MVYVSVRGRILLNAEALNMTESVGNYVKRRRVPVMVPLGGSYSLFFVPAISGEAVAHAYQVLLAKEANRRNLPVCKLCEKGILLKSANDEVLRYAFPRVKFPPKKIPDPNKKGKEINNPDFGYDFEKAVVSNCVVEDVGGFLYAQARGGANVKRTSNFLTGYMIPVKEALENIVIDPQLHTRYALGTQLVKSEEQAGQMIYYVELSSAPYTFSFDLDTTSLGRITFDTNHMGEEVVNSGETVSRAEAALDALSKLLIEVNFGAKRTRFLPNAQWESIAIAISDDIWTVPSPFTSDYLERAKSKLEKVNHNTKLFYYPEDKASMDDAMLGSKKAVSKAENIKVEGKASVEEAVLEAIKEAKSRLKT
ncbi:MAG: type I-A CRISPR-associated protein Cas7/Csa2 [Candidatus Korarchaeota archaeon]|nr:type I-A CRISPR-associated protein Cas7/Csa2 [Candidatus Korarchaeota archaeon]